jgi:hypothetical protein
MNDDRPITSATLRRAMRAMLEAPRSGCPPHVVHPPPASHRWELADAPGEGVRLLRCANLCGFAAWFRAVPE